MLSRLETSRESGVQRNAAELHFSLTAKVQRGAWFAMSVHEITTTPAPFTPAPSRLRRLKQLKGNESDTVAFRWRRPFSEFMYHVGRRKKVQM